MKNLSIMIKPASSACNLRCRYCFYADVAKNREIPSFGPMSRETLEIMLETIRKDLLPGDSVCFGFQGGEPTLAGLSYFQEFVRLTGGWDRRIRVNYSIQTNGILLDEAWCRFFRDHGFLVGLSLDLLPEMHNAVRVDPRGEGTYKAVVEAMHLLKKHQVEFNILCTLTDQIARHPGQAWKQMKKLDIRYVQFTPCLDELETPGRSPCALTPERFASFYTRLFQLWEADFRRGDYRSVKFFDDLVNLLAFGVPTGCGIDGLCRPQMVVEADGSVYPCDFYCLDQYKTGSFRDNSLKELYESPVNAQFITRPHRQPPHCAACPYARLCGGHCKRMQQSVCLGKTCGLRTFLEEAMPSLQEIARTQRARRGY